MLKTSLVELALEEHLAVLSDPFAIKEQVKKQYVIKCVEDIREVLLFDSVVMYYSLHPKQTAVFLYHLSFCLFHIAHSPI